MALSNIHGPDTTGTIKAGSVTPPTAAPTTFGSGANSGVTLIVGAGTLAPNKTGAPETTTGASGANAGKTFTVAPGTKQPLAPPGKGTMNNAGNRKKAGKITGAGKGEQLGTGGGMS